MLRVNDRRKELFENIWPLPDGVSYNCYLVEDDKNVLLDTVESGSDGDFVSHVASVLGDKPLDYLVINHMEPDHSGEFGAIVERYPDIKIVGNSQTRKILENYYPDMAGERFMEVTDGQTLNIGKRTLHFVFTPWVHWPETMMTYVEGDGILFSADAFGTFGVSDANIVEHEGDLASYESEMRRYYTNIVGKYGGMVQKALAKLSGFDIKMICPLHGPAWKSDISELIGLYDQWSKYEPEEGSVLILYASMYNNTARMADSLALRIAERGVKNIKIYDVSKTHLSYLISETFRCKYILLGSCAYNGFMFPMMDFYCSNIKQLNIKQRSLAIFGGHSWNGGGVRMLDKFAEEIGWEKICDSVDVRGMASADKMSAFDDMVDAVADKALGER